MTSGRPKASSRETLAEAACELFLERGYESTTVADIAARAGVSRSSFFNYFASKADILWAGLDERIAEAEATLASGGDIRGSLTRIGDGFAPDSLALALVNAAAMGLEEELSRESAGRRGRLAQSVARALRARGVGTIEAEVAGAAHGGAVLAAIELWAHQGPGVAPLADILDSALDAAAPTLPVAVHGQGVAEGR